MNQNNNTNEIVVALDIGTTKVCAVVGRKDEYGKIEILGTGRVESTGVMRGVVSNIEKTVKAISEAVTEAEKRSGVQIGVVHVGIAGQHIKSLQHRGVLMRDSVHDEIQRQDVEKLISDMHKLVLPPGDKILHAIPQEFIVDNEMGIVDPVGISGVRLEANFHIITGQTTAFKNIYKCVEKANLETASLTLEPLASAEAVLFHEEKESGVVLVDIGGGTTDLAIFHEGIIRHTAVIPFGGNIITKDIKEGCTVMAHQAEQLKTSYGSALPDALEENRIISIPGLSGRDPKEISEVNLARIIHARMEEIFDHVFWEIRRSGYERKLVCGIVLTGGGALLKHIRELAEYHTGMHTRIGYPIERLAHGYSAELYSPAFATAIGLLLRGIQQTEQASEPAPVAAQTSISNLFRSKPSAPARAEAKEKQDSWLDSILTKTREWFETDPESDRKI
jgi:cell division protein FtsA